MPTTKHIKEIAKILKLNHGEKVFNKSALARKSWYRGFDIYDEDYEEVIGQQYVNFNEELSQLEEYIKTRLIEELEKVAISRVDGWTIAERAGRRIRELREQLKVKDIK